jgi:glycosyltransferase involved in cell wall biosynthesis
MKVLMCITDLNKGGAEKMFFYICSKTSFLGYNFEPIVVSFLGGYYEEKLKSENIKIFTLLKNKNLFRIFKAIFEYICFLFKERTNIHIVHAFMPHGGGLALFSNLILKKPYIYAIRNSRYEIINKKNYLSSIFKIFADKLSIKLANLITCNSDYIKKTFKESLKEKIIIIYNCIEEPTKEMIYDEKIFKNYYYEKDKYYVTSICNMRYPQKDIITLLNVAKLLPNLNFVLVGDGESLEYFKKYAYKLDLKNVCFAGFQENIYPFLKYANCKILLTRYEGFPNVVLEAMIIKCPVIVSDIPEIRGILIDKQNAILVKNEAVEQIRDALLLLLNNKELREKIVTNAYNLAINNFSLKKMIENNYTTYIKLLKEN